MAINNFSLLQPNQSLTATDKLLADINNFNNTVMPNFPAPVIPPVNVPKYTRFGDNLATLGGFGDQPNELLAQEQLAKMTQDQVDAYNQQRKRARTQGMGELLMRFGDALQGKNASQLAYGRQQVRDSGDAKAAYQQAINIAEASGDFRKANLLRSLGLPGFQQLQQKVAIAELGIGTQASNERFGVYDKDTKQLIGSVLKSDSAKISELENTPGVIVGQLRSPTVSTGKDGKMDLYSVTDAGGKRVKTISNPTQQDIDELNRNNLFVNKLPTATDRGKGLDSGKPIEYRGWNDDNGLKTRYFATNTLINTGERLLQQLSKNPDSVLTAADLAQYFERAKAEVGAIGGRPENYTSHLKNSQQSKIKDLAQDAAVSESMLLDFTFQIAQARGQTGRGLSDKDFVIFQKIISAGLTADQKAAALTSFIEGIASEVNEDLTSNYNFYSKRLEDDPDDKEAMTFVTGIDDLRSMPFRNVVNPFAQPTNGTADPLGIR